MKILSAEQLRQADAHTIASEPISSQELMERAAKNCVTWLLDRRVLLKFNDRQKFVIFCGIGNNGGDGLVMARLLKEAGYEVRVLILDFSEKHSGDFEINLQRLSAMDIPIEKLTAGHHTVELQKEEILIDAILGSGLSRGLNGWISEVVKTMNNSGNRIISIDLPSGMFAAYDEGDEPGVMVHADLTLTFQAPKLSFLVPEPGRFAGDWRVLDIGLSREFIDGLQSDHLLMTMPMIREMLKLRSKYSHKGTYGHALLIGGSRGKTGAMVLAARACMRSGAGLVTAHVPSGSLEVLQTAIPEVMVVPDEERDMVSSLSPRQLEKYDAIGIGPGMGLDPASQQVLKSLIQHAETPLVIDADGLNILAENKTWLAFLPKHSVLTPHPGEFRRLAGEWKNDFDRLRLQREMSVRHGIIVVVKGAHTTITSPEGKVYFNSTGNPGMATAGSGDTLTGIITAMMAQRYAPLEATLIGVFLHGLAGDIAAAEREEESMIASDIIDNLGGAFAKVKELG